MEINENTSASGWTWVGLAVALLGAPAIGSPVFQPLYGWLSGGDPLLGVLVGQSFMWLLAGLTLAILVFGEKVAPAGIGLVAPRMRSAWLGLGVGLGVYAALAAAAAALWALGLFDNKQEAQAVLALPTGARAYIAVTAGVTEEILFRGYALNRLARATGRPRLSACLVIAAFALAHAPFWGWSGMAVPLVGGVFFTLIYMWRRDLVACVVAHAAIDLISLVVLPALAKMA